MHATARECGISETVERYLRGRRPSAGSIERQISRGRRITSCQAGLLARSVRRAFSVRAPMARSATDILRNLQLRVQLRIHTGFPFDSHGCPLRKLDARKFNDFYRTASRFPYFSSPEGSNVGGGCADKRSPRPISPRAAVRGHLILTTSAFVRLNCGMASPIEAPMYVGSQTVYLRPSSIMWSPGVSFPKHTAVARWPG